MPGAGTPTWCWRWRILGWERRSWTRSNNSRIDAMPFCPKSYSLTKAFFLPSSNARAASMQWHLLCRQRKGWGCTIQCNALALPAKGMKGVQTRELDIDMTRRYSFGLTCGRQGPSWSISSGKSFERSFWLVFVWKNAWRTPSRF